MTELDFRLGPSPGRPLVRMLYAFSLGSLCPEDNLDPVAYCAAIGRKLLNDSAGDEGDWVERVGERVRARLVEASRRSSDGDVAEGGKRFRQNVSLSLMSS